MSKALQGQRTKLKQKQNWQKRQQSVRADNHLSVASRLWVKCLFYKNSFITGSASVSFTEWSKNVFSLSGRHILAVSNVAKYAYRQIVLLLPQFFWIWDRKFHRSETAKVPGNESSTGVKVIFVDFLFPGAKVQGNEKSRYRLIAPINVKFCTGSGADRRL